MPRSVRIETSAEEVNFVHFAALVLLLGVLFGVPAMIAAVIVFVGRLIHVSSQR